MELEKMIELSNRIADKLGTQTILLQTIEECAELSHAISKYNRANGLGQSTDMTKEECLKQIALELADVSNCIVFMIHSLNLDEMFMEAKMGTLTRLRKKHLDTEGNSAMEIIGDYSSDELIDIASEVDKLLIYAEDKYSYDKCKTVYKAVEILQALAQREKRNEPCKV